MLATAASILQAADTALIVFGSGGAATLAVWLLATGRWRRPLANVRRPTTGPTIAEVAIVLFAFGCLLLAWQQMNPLPPGVKLTPGSDPWYRANTAQSVLYLVISALMMGLLWRSRGDAATPQVGSVRMPATPDGGTSLPPTAEDEAAPAVQFGAAPISAEGVTSATGGNGPTPRRPRLTLLRGIGAAVAGVLIIVPVTGGLLQLGNLVWQWLQPAAQPPEHPVIEALRHSAWGTWGVVQLVVSAIVLAPLVEELFFRGVLLGALSVHMRSWRPAIIVSSIAFGLVHLPQPQAVVPLIAMGLLQAFLRVRLGALWPCVLLHALFNARTILFSLLSAASVHAG